MFNKNNFCHIASNNRNEKKAGVFVYKTTDDLATVLTSGYFNDKIVDINLHDLIIHEWHNPADRTKVQRNVLCVVERTLDNVGTTVIKSKWEGDIEQAIKSIQDDIETIQDDIETIQDDITDIKEKDIEQDGRLNDIEEKAAYKATDFATPITTTNKGITQTEETALNSKIDLAANSGRMITNQGVWYAKMYAGTTAPAADDDTNYADFSQTDGQGNPIIVIYERQSGAWVQSETITPPAEYDGYVPITSKIWDIPEQAGQQGGRILWNHQSKEFTPYPQIISFENINVTGTSTVAMPQNPGADQIVNKGYVDSEIQQAIAESSDFDLFDPKWRDATTNNKRWLLSDGNWKTKTNAYQHLVDDVDNIQKTTLYRWRRYVAPSYLYVYTLSATPAVGDAIYQKPYDAYYQTDHIVESVPDSTHISMEPDGSFAYAYDGPVEATVAQRETVNGTTIVYYQADDGHKICPASQESNVAAIYNATGVAWYYIIDTTKQQFKLPRTKFGFTGIRNGVGGFVNAGLPNITGAFRGRNAFNDGPVSYTGAFGVVYSGSTSGASGAGSSPYYFDFDASRSSSIYGKSDTVQPKATQMYLYFYVGA